MKFFQARTNVLSVINSIAHQHIDVIQTRRLLRDIAQMMCTEQKEQKLATLEYMHPLTVYTLFSPHTVSNWRETSQHAANKQSRIATKKVHPALHHIFDEQPWLFSGSISSKRAAI